MSEKKRRRWGLRLGVVCGAFLVALLALEGAVRVYAAFFFPKLMTVDRALGWRHNADCQKPFKNEDGEDNLVVQNRWGHRGSEYDRQRTSGKLRVLCLGDSFTEAVHVSEEQLFTRLVEKSSPDLEVLNAGVGGWGTVQQYLYLRNEGLSFRPDVVLLMVFENDFVDNRTSYSPAIGARPWADLSGDQVKIVEDYDDTDYLRFVAPVPFRSFLSRNSYAFYAFNERVWQRAVADRLRGFRQADEAALDPDDNKRVMLYLLSRLHELTRDAGSELAIALIPSREAVEAKENPLYDPVVAWGKRTKVPCLLLLRALVTATAAGKRCYFERDIHLTQVGHQVAAAALIPFVARLGK